MSRRNQTQTKSNTEFMVWCNHSCSLFAGRGFRKPTYREAMDAYEVGESPETFVDYAAGMEDWGYD